MKKLYPYLLTLMTSCGSADEEVFIPPDNNNNKNNQILITLPSVKVGNNEAFIGDRYIIDVYRDSTNNWRAIIRELGHE